MRLILRRTASQQDCAPTMPKILVADDDASSRRLYASLLAPYGYCLLEARDGQEGLSIAQAENPDLVICDIVMPTISVYQFVQALRSLSQHQQTPVIFHSVNFLDEEARSLGPACGISRFILKPFDPQQALATIQEALKTGLQEAPAPLPPVAKRDPIPLLLNAYFVKGKKLDASVQLASLVEVGIALAHAQQTSQLLEIAMTAARTLTDANFAAAGILGKSDSIDAQTLALSGFDETTVAQLRQSSFSPPFLRELLATRRPQRIFNPSEASLALLLPPLHPKVRSLLVVPLESSGRAYGWMMVAEKSDSQAFTEEDERMLRALASQTITCYESAQRFDTIQEHAKDLELQIEERERAEHRFRMLLETSPIGIVISDGAGRIEDVNAEALRLFGYEREELVGQMIEILVPQRLQRAHAGHRSLYARDPRTRSMGAGMELFACRKDGTEFPIEVGLGPLATKEGVLVSSTIVDITARRKMEEQLRLSQRMDAIGRLAGGVAHDFNNLLTVILGNSDVVLDSLPPGPPAIQKLEIIRKAGQVCRGHARHPDYFEFLDGGVTRWKRVQDDVRVPQDHGQQIVEVVGHATSEPANGIHALRQPELFLHLSSCGDIHDGAGDEDAFFGGQRPQTDFYGKLGAILAASEQLHACAHGARAGVAGIEGAMAGVSALKALGYEYLNHLSD